MDDLSLKQQQQNNASVESESGEKVLITEGADSNTEHDIPQQDLKSPLYSDTSFADWNL